MVFQTRSKTEKFRIQNIAAAGPNVYFTEILGSQNDHGSFTGTWFRMEKGPVVTAPPYTYDEIGVVVEGTMTLEDETGKKEDLQVGDTFIVHQGSTIKFSSTDYGVAWKCGAHPPAKL